MMIRIIALTILTTSMLATAAESLTWKKLPNLPDAEGFAGSFAGVASGRLIVAGGTNFPDKRPWEGGTKIWYDQVYALSAEGAQWEKAGTLPRPNGYGVSITTDRGLVCVGGGNADENFRSVYLLRWEKGQVKAEALPDLPKACAFMTGAKLGSVIYIAGGIETPAATTALATFWSLDLANLGRGWQELAPWPGPERILASMGAMDGTLYLFSGARLKAGADGKPAREWLDDAYGYSPNKGWRRIASLPRVAVAAPSPIPVLEGRLLILGGDDGALVDFEPKDKHPGFPRDILSYDPGADAWTRKGELPFSLVTSPAVVWNGKIVIPGGEARPGKRSPEVWQTGK